MAALVDLLRDGLAAGVVVAVRHEPHDAAQRLLYALGARWVVDAGALPCVIYCGRPECGVVAIRNEKAVTGGRVLGGHSRIASTAFEPNWIDYRASRARVDRRVDKGETPEVCAGCGCEVDVKPEPHSPRCEVADVLPFKRSSSGRELLDRMDAGEPVAEEPDESGPADPPRLQEDDAPRAPEAAPDPGATGGASTNGKRRYIRWTRELALERVREVAAELGYPPTQAQIKQFDLPAANPTLKRLGFGTWGDFLVEAGFERPEKGSHRTTPPGPARQWTRELVIEQIRAWAAGHGAPPTSKDWVKAGDDHPTSMTVIGLFGSWANGVEAAGFERPTRGTRRSRAAVSERVEGVVDPDVTGSAKAGEEDSPSTGDGRAVDRLASRPTPVRPPRSDTAGWIKVPGTGLVYRSPAEAYVAADEIEADGERVAAGARDDGNHGKADQAIDGTRELAEKIRVAARAADERAAGSAVPPAAAFTTSGEPSRAIALAAVAAARTFADTLEQLLAEDTCR